MQKVMRVILAIQLLITLPVVAAGPEITVFKSRTCSCCANWVAHLRANGFTVKVNEVDSTAPYQKQHGVPSAMASCHTAVVNGYTIEGHVPAREIQRLLKERPKGKGLAVPGMPIGSPGMENGTRRQAYSVMLFDTTGRASVYQAYPASR